MNSLMRKSLDDLEKGDRWLDIYGRTWVKSSYKGEAAEAFLEGDPCREASLFVGTTLRYTCTREEALADLQLRLEHVGDAAFAVDEWMSATTLNFKIETMEEGHD